MKEYIGITFTSEKINNKLLECTGLFLSNQKQRTTTDVEVPLTLADVLMVNGSVYPYNNDHENFALMGQYGNVMLLNGQTNYQLNVNTGQVVRFFLADTSNARPYNFTIQGHIKVDRRR